MLKGKIYNLIYPFSFCMSYHMHCNLHVHTNGSQLLGNDYCQPQSFLLITHSTPEFIRAEHRLVGPKFGGSLYVLGAFH